MSKQKINISQKVMERIKKEDIKMKPRWYFVMGGVALALGVIGSYLLATFLVSLISFSLRTHGPMVNVRWQQLLSSFPWWAVPLTVFGLVGGIWLMRKYDFSYKKNSVYIVLGFILMVVLSGWLIDYTGVDKTWFGGGAMKKMYQKYDGRKGKVLPWRSEENSYPRHKNGQKGKTSLY